MRRPTRKPQSSLIEVDHFPTMDQHRRARQRNQVTVAPSCSSQDAPVDHFPAMDQHRRARPQPPTPVLANALRPAPLNSEGAQPPRTKKTRRGTKGARRNKARPAPAEGEEPSPPVDQSKDPGVVEEVEEEEEDSHPVDQSEDPGVVEKDEEKEEDSHPVDQSEDPGVVEKDEEKEEDSHPVDQSEDPGVVEKDEEKEEESQPVDHSEDPGVVEEDEAEEGVAAPEPASFLPLPPPIFDCCGVPLCPAGTRVRFYYRPVYINGPYGVQVTTQAVREYTDAFGNLYWVYYGPVVVHF